MPAESPFIIRSAKIEARADARAIVEAAEDEARRVRAAAQDERIATLEAARRDGMRQGLAEAASVAARTADAVETFWRERERELRDVALAVAHRILSSLPADDVTSRLASEAIAEHARDSHLELRAAPETADLLRKTFEDRPSGAQVTVVTDPTLPRDACALLHPRGRSEIGLLAQFRSLMAASDPTGGSPA